MFDTVRNSARVGKIKGIDLHHGQTSTRYLLAYMRLHIIIDREFKHLSAEQILQIFLRKLEESELVALKINTS